jgi:hydroxymethylpyrimidine/phosphomethylpyrimidine kinase
MARLLRRAFQAPGGSALIRIKPVGRQNPAAIPRPARYRQPMQTLGRVLIVAGSDSGGGAGVQADIKTVTALGGYAATAITAITVQNTLGVSGVHPVPLEVVAAQARAVLDDIGADALKTGMLGDTAAVEAVAGILDSAAGVPAVVDPVMIAKGGAPLLAADAVDAVKRLMVPRAALLTPNAPEAEALTGLSVADADDLRRAGDALLAMGARAVLMKGGHVPGARVTDVLMTADGETVFEAERQDTRHTHGTGCTLASACATGLAQGLPLTDAVARAWAYVQEAMARAPGLGRGHGPLDHGWTLR